MNADGFIKKQQFQAVYDHFSDVIDNCGNEMKLNDLQTEFRLLLDYFRSIYKESERKTHKILHLMTKISKDNEKRNKMQKQSDEEREKITVQLNETRKNLNELLRKEVILIKQIDELKENIENLKSVGNECEDFLYKYKTLLRGSRSFKDIGVATEELTENSKEICRLCSERHSGNNQIASQEKYEDTISELSKKVNALSTELKLSYKDREELRSFIACNNERLADLKHQLAKEREFGEGIQKDLVRDRRSLKTTIDKLVLDLYSKKCEIEDLQEALEKEIVKRNTIILESKGKDAVLENMNRKLNSVQQSREFESRKANIFEDQLVTDRERLGSLQNTSDLLKEEVDDLKKELRTHETQQKLQMAQQKWLEVSQKTEMNEQNKVIEHCKSQIATRDKRIRALTLKMSDSGRQMGVLRKQFKEKVKENIVLRSDLSKLKTTASEQNDSLQSLKMKLETMESSSVQLQAELKSMKSQNEALLKEKNKLYRKYKELCSKFESQEMNIILLNKQQEYHQNALKVSNSKFEKQGKKRRCTTTKY